mmetsp:Transcript_92010/g.256329  ORF Transcript_92010/g.256329 Transcript_92010/m.256329 type:complete len:563 (+) Transcript_92010:63-1751(+)
MSDGSKRPRLAQPSDANISDAVLRRIAELLLSKASVEKLASIEELADDALAWAAAHGVVMYKVPAVKAQAATVPCTLLPTPFAADLYAQAMDMSPTFHALMDRVTLDIPWIQNTLAVTGRMDVICGRLLEICSRIYGAAGKVPSEDIRLHIMRNDFMLDTQSQGKGFPMKQIELNMIAASFSTHSEDLTEIHRYILTKYLRRLDPALELGTVGPVLAQALPASPNAAGIAAAMAEAHRAYEGRWQATGRPRVVLFVAEASENNEMDHRKLEAALWGHGVVSLRRSLSQLAAHGEALLMRLEAGTPGGTGNALSDGGHARPGRLEPKALVVDGHEVSVAYFRSGYWPAHFTSEACWKARELIEASEAVKCPSAPAQLAGMKKVQQMLCEPEHLRRFLAPEEAERVRRSFAGMSDPSATSEEARRCVEAAKARPDAWVLKPQVEGSGELIFDADIPRVLNSRSAEELAEFILMERVRPPVTPSAVYLTEEGKRAKVVVRESVTEFGIFGAFVANGPEVLQNKAFGHLLRSKAQQTNQGGVFVGNAVVDAPLLVPPEIFWPAACQ